MEKGLLTLRSAKGLTWRAFRVAVRVAGRDVEAPQQSQPLLQPHRWRRPPVQNRWNATRPWRGDGRSASIVWGRAVRPRGLAHRLRQWVEEAQSLEPRRGQRLAPAGPVAKALCVLPPASLHPLEKGLLAMAHIIPAGLIPPSRPWGPPEGRAWSNHFRCKRATSPGRRPGRHFPPACDPTVQIIDCPPHAETMCIFTKLSVRSHGQVAPNRSSCSSRPRLRR